MQTAAEVHEALGKLYASTWSLAAVAVASERGLLEALAAGTGGLGELAERTGLGATVVAALVDVLAAKGLVVAGDPRRPTIWPTWPRCSCPRRPSPTATRACCAPCVPAPGW